MDSRESRRNSTRLSASKKVLDNLQPGHTLNDAQKTKQNLVESLDFDISESVIFLQHRLSGLFSTSEFWIETYRWIVIMVIGICTGCVAFYIDFFLKYMTQVKFDILLDSWAKPGSGKSFGDVFVVWLFINAGLTIIASILVSFIEPVAGGSGIPEIKCLLNGCRIRNVIRFKTLLVKSTGVLFSVAATLPVGKEGPMIHSGAIIGGGLSQGYSPTFGFKTPFLRLSQSFRTDLEKRDFVAAGAAAGVTAAFGAPIGGTLFSLEEGSSFYNQKLIWKNFFGCMVTGITINFLKAGAIVKGLSWGQLSAKGLVDFGAFSAKGQKYEIQELPFFVFLGIFGGLLGALFNTLNTKLTIWRKKNSSTPAKRFAEAVSISLIVSIVLVLPAYAFFRANPHVFCRHISEITDGNPGTTRQFYCPDDHFNEPATLFFTQSEDAILHLLHQGAEFKFHYGLLFVFFILYYLLACLVYGIAVPSGLFVPSLLAGCIYGRIYGQLLQEIFPFIQPGTYALCGAASMLGGMARITISVVVILVEATQDVTFAPPVTLTIMFAKFVGDVFNHGLYDIHIHLNCVPMLEYDPPQKAEVLLAKDVSRLQKLVTFPVLPTVRQVWEALTQTRHNAFPVVEECSNDEREKLMDQSSHPKGLGAGPGHLVGMISRDEIVMILSRRAWFSSDEGLPSVVKMVVRDPKGLLLDYEEIREPYPRFPNINDIHISPGDMDNVVDLSPYMNHAPYTVRDVAPISRTFRQFRYLGLRHLPIVNSRNIIVGILTRKNLTPEALEEVLATKSPEELRVLATRMSTAPDVDVVRRLTMVGRPVL